MPSVLSNRIASGGRGRREGIGVLLEAAAGGDLVLGQGGGVSLGENLQREPWRPELRGPVGDQYFPVGSGLVVTAGGRYLGASEPARSDTAQDAGASGGAAARPVTRPRSLAGTSVGPAAAGLLTWSCYDAGVTNRAVRGLIRRS